MIAFILDYEGTPLNSSAKMHPSGQSLFLQVFMMPGAIFINVLAGSLYGLWGTFLVIAAVSTLGASLNYWLSRLIVRVSLLQSKHSQPLTKLCLMCADMCISMAWFHGMCP